MYLAVCQCNQGLCIRMLTFCMVIILWAFYVLSLEKDRLVAFLMESYKIYADPQDYTKKNMSK